MHRKVINKCLNKPVYNVEIWLILFAMSFSTYPMMANIYISMLDKECVKTIHKFLHKQIPRNYKDETKIFEIPMNKQTQ